MRGQLCETVFAACEDGKFDCGNGRCIDTSQVCDYFDNCVDELITDEFNCSHPPGKFLHREV